MSSVGIKSLFRLLCLLTLSIVEAAPDCALPEKPMVVVVASYNNQEWVYQNLISIFMQDYSNYRVIYIDDASTDGTADAVERLVKEKGQESRVTLVRNTKRQGGLCNLCHAVSSCQDEEIILNVDGDDWLANGWVFKTVNEVYSKQDIWLTHGAMIEYPEYKLGWSIPIPEKVIQKNKFRTTRCPSHLKTFYVWLFRKIDVEDLKYKGEFFPMTWDQAIMFPMIEMAGKRHAFIPDILYVYNMRNPINDNKVNAQLQRDLEKMIRDKPAYQTLAEAPR